MARATAPPRRSSTTRAIQASRLVGRCWDREALGRSGGGATPSLVVGIFSAERRPLADAVGGSDGERGRCGGAGEPGEECAGSTLCECGMPGEDAPAGGADAERARPRL